MPSPPWAGMSTSIGSLPHRDPSTATEFILRLHPHLPAAPQLPRHSPRESMIAQALAGIPGVRVEPNGAVAVFRDELDPDNPIDGTFTEDYWSGYLRFLSVINGTSGPFKFQITGALTLTLALMAHEVPRELAFALARESVGARAAALRRLLDRYVPDAAVLVFIDEPALVTTAPESLPVERPAAIEALIRALEELGPDVATGVHCCGSADWRYVLPAHPDIVSFPVGGELARNAWPLREHLRRGGCIAWGAVPTTPPFEFDPDILRRRLADDWSVLVEAGCDEGMLHRQALITPACGLLGMTIREAELALRTTNTLAKGLRPQSI